MKRPTVESRLRRLEEEMRQLQANKLFALIKVATREETERMQELLAEADGQGKAKISLAEMPELFTILETLYERFIAMQGKE